MPARGEDSRLTGRRRRAAQLIGGAALVMVAMSPFAVLLAVLGGFPSQTRPLSGVQLMACAAGAAGLAFACTWLGIWGLTRLGGVPWAGRDSVPPADDSAGDEDGPFAQAFAQRLQVDTQLLQVRERELELAEVTALRSRYFEAVRQLADGTEIVRIAGAYGLSAVATEWLKLGRADECQICVDVVCAALRGTRHTGGDEPATSSGLRDSIVELLRLHLPTMLGTVPDDWRCCRINLAGADLAGANLPGTFLGTANLSLTSLRNANLRGANLDDATLERADLFEADIAGGDLSYADLTNAVLDGAQLGGAKLRNAELSRALLRTTNLAQCDLRSATAEEADLSAADLTAANLTATVLSGANLAAANLSGTILRDATLQEANLSGSNLCGATLDGVDLSTTNLGRVVYSSSTIWPRGFIPPTNSHRL